MFSLFRQEEEAPAWLAEAAEIQQRFFVFLEKLEAKTRELADAAIPELNSMRQNDSDPYKRTYGRMLSAVRGQLSHIRQKASEVEAEKVNGFYYQVHAHIGALSKHHHLLNTFRQECRDRYQQFEQLHRSYEEKILATDWEDLELKYRAILQEYETIKNSFRCRQCSSPITIDKIFFITTYIQCPACQTQNTFEPSSQAKGLEMLGRSLAEQRTAGMLQAYEAEKEKERALYHQLHELKLSLIHEKDKKVIAEKTALQQQLAAQREEAICQAPLLYEQYLRAMFDEWNSIVPDLAEQNEKFYRRMLDDFRTRGM
jgi:DNA-directed RNA polymerase subunit RPC12/RpoP